MYKQCQTELSAARQRQLERGLLDVMLQQQFEHISVCDLCDKLNIPRKAFYRYFSGKEGALYSLIDHAIMDFDMYSTEKGVKQTRSPQQYMEQVFAYWIRNQALLDALARSNLSGVLIQRAVVFTKKMNTLPSFLGTLDQQLRDYGNQFVVCGLMSMVVQWHHDGFSQDASQMAGLAIRLLSEPLFDQNEKY